MIREDTLPPIYLDVDVCDLVWADDDDAYGDEGDEVRSEEDLCTQIERSLEDSLAEV